MASDEHPSRRIALLVDDSPETLRSVAEALENAGLTALVARDGSAALALLERVAPDIILLDAMMPGLDGFATCTAIKSRPAFALTPVVFMTGLSDPDHVVRGLRAGGVDYVTKPVDHAVLLARIETHMVNADFIRQARAALDTGMQGVAVFARNGTLRWMSPNAQDILGAVLSAPSPRVRERLDGWLRQIADTAVSRAPMLDLELPDASGIQLDFLGAVPDAGLLVRVRVPTDGADGEQLSAALGISQREGEVLSWLSHGKSNRDIATILGVSPRTITKHLEQVYAKLEVENRTAAAAVALRVLRKEAS